jgi:peptidoglycan hydrolase CwlO-like protein
MLSGVTFGDRSALEREEQQAAQAAQAAAAAAAAAKKREKKKLKKVSMPAPSVCRHADEGNVFRTWVTL